MKKIKLLAPIVGSLTALSAVIPAASCNFKEEEVKTYTVSVNKGFTLTNTDPVEYGESWQSDVKWTDETKIVNASNVKVMVGNRKLIRNEDFTYTNSKTKSKVGTIKIYDGLINADVTIELSLMDANKAPVTLTNIGIEGIEVESETKDTDVGKDLTMLISWDNATTVDQKYFSNLITVFVGLERVYARSETETSGWWYRIKSESSIELTVPKENITSNAEIIILVDLEKSSYDRVVTLDQLRPHSIRYAGTQYFDALTTPGSATQQGLYLHIAQNETIEFAIDLNLWEDVVWQNPISNATYLDFAVGSWDWEFDVIEGLKWVLTAFDLSTGASGEVYYGQTKLDVELDTECSFPAYLLSIPDGGTWGAKGSRQWITGWYQFADDHSSQNVQFLLGLPSKLN